MIDADVMVYYTRNDQVQAVLDEPNRQFLKAVETGSEVFLGDMTIAALSRVSLLSIPVVLDSLVPMLEAAADGDPATVVEDARP